MKQWTDFKQDIHRETKRLFCIYKTNMGYNEIRLTLEFKNMIVKIKNINKSRIEWTQLKAS